MSQSQAKTIISELFENVQYQVFNNGGSAQVMNDTPDHKVGSSYSPLELFPDSPSARVGMQNELNNLLSYLKPDSLYPALIRDAQYSITGFNANIEKLRLLAVYRSEGVKVVDLDFEDSENVKGVYITDLKHANTLGKMYAKITGKNYIGYYVDKCCLKSLKTAHRHLKATNRNILSKVALNKTEFLIPDHGKISTPFQELDFWQWLAGTGYNGTQSIIGTKQAYLRSLGFNRGLHTIPTEDHPILKHCQDHFYFLNFVKGAK